MKRPTLYVVLSDGIHNGVALASPSKESAEVYLRTELSCGYHAELVIYEPKEPAP